MIPVAALGLVLGSFVTALTHRLPRGEAITHGRSACPVCGHTLSVPDLIPLISWLFQRGRCRYCRAPISRRYPVIELAMCALFIAGGVLVRDLRILSVLLAATVVMVTMAVYDFEQHRIPNGLIVILAILALSWRWLTDRNFVMATEECAIVFVVAILLSAGFRAAVGTPGLGMGDTKLMAAAGLALSPGALLLFLLVGGALGVLFGLSWRQSKSISHFPFAPALIVALWIGLVRGDAILHWVQAKFF